MSHAKLEWPMIRSQSKKGKEIIQGKNPVGTPQFPGMQTGKTIEEIRALIKKLKRCKGYTFVVPTGQENFNLDLSGSARVWLGFALLPPEPDNIAGMPNSITLTINEEKVIDQVHPDFYSGRYMDEEYYSIPRPVSGRDIINLAWDNPGGAQTWRMIAYYL